MSFPWLTAEPCSDQATICGFVGLILLCNLGCLAVACLILMYMELAQNDMMTGFALVCKPKAFSCGLSLEGAAYIWYGHGSLAIKHRHEEP